MSTASLAPASGAPRIEELESIRGLAALLVVFHHLPKWNALGSTAIVDNGYLMVELFFVLSGFVICSAYSDRIESGRDLLRFQFLRLGRLYPVHLVFLLAFVAIEAGKYVAQAHFGLSSPNTAPFRENSPDALLQQLLLLQAVLPDGSVLSFNYPAWSISVEFYTYLLFAAVALLAGRRRNLAFAVLAVAALAALLTERTLGVGSLLHGIAGFFIGCLTAAAVAAGRWRVPAWVPAAFIVAIVAFLQLKAAGEGDLVIYALSAGLIFALVRSGDGVVKRALRLKALTWLGTISYSVYMSHAAVEWLANQVIRVLLKRPEVVGAAGRSVPQLSAAEMLVAYAAVVAAVLVVSQLVYVLVERPGREASRRLAFAWLGPARERARAALPAPG